MSELRVSSLTIKSGHTTLIQEISFHISAKTNHGLIGESGSGKSLTARAVLGLLPHPLRATGSISLNGVELLNHTERERVLRQGSTIAYIPQDPLASLDPTMRIGRHFRAHHTKRPTLAVNELLDAVELFDHESILRSYPHQLSGGQRQRILIALALVGSPELIIADEPTSALDLGLQRPIINLITSLAQQWSSSLLLISHDIALVAASTSELTVLYQGSLCETGATIEILRQPRHPYSADLLKKARSYYQPSSTILPSLTEMTADSTTQLPLELGEPQSTAPLAGCPYSRICPYGDPHCEAVLPPLVTQGPSSFRCFHPLASDHQRSAP